MEKRLTTVGLALMTVALNFLLAIPAAAAEADRGDARYNIAIVVDASGSLSPTDNADPQGNRFLALKYFLGMLDAKGHVIAAFVFNDKVKEVYPFQSINSDKAKKELLSAIEAIPAAGSTNIGDALKMAVNNLKKVQNKQDVDNGSHLQSEVILFTDGVTDLPTPAAEQASFTARDQAISIAKANGIHVSGVFLNDKGLIQGNQEVFDIVRAVRGNDTDPSASGIAAEPGNDFYSYFAEIQSANDISGSFANIVLRLSAGGEVSTEPETVPIDRSVMIPGVGVSELKFGLRYNRGVKNKIVVTILPPEGDAITESGGNGMAITKDDISYIAKMQNPIAGCWKIHVGKADNVPFTEEVEVMADIIISSNVAAKLAMQVTDGKAKVGEPITFRSSLEVDGVAISDAARYEGYTCTLTLVSIKTKQPKEYLMELSGGHFEVQVPVEEYEGYAAFVTYKCENITFRSDDITVKPVNQPPVVEDVQDKYAYTLFNDGVYAVALTDYATDPEGETALAFTLDESDYADDSIAIDDDGNLRIDTGKQKGIGTVRIKVTDPEGAFSVLVLELTTQSGNWIYILVLVVIILLIAGALFLIKIMKASGRIRAEFSVKVEEDGSEVAQGKDFLGGGAKFTLYELLTQSYAEWDGDDERAKEIITENKSILNAYVFKAKKHGEFLFGRGKNVRLRKETSFNETVNLDDDNILYVGVQNRDKDGDESTTPNYDDNDDDDDDD